MISSSHRPVSTWSGVTLKTCVRLTARSTNSAYATTPTPAKIVKSVPAISFSARASRLARYSATNLTTEPPNPRSSTEKYAVNEAVNIHRPYADWPRWWTLKGSSSRPMMPSTTIAM